MVVIPFHTIKNEPTKHALSGWTMQMSIEGMPLNYNRNEMIDKFSRYVITEKMLINHGKSQAYEYFTRQTLQPQYRVTLGTLLNTAQLNYMKKTL